MENSEITTKLLAFMQGDDFCRQYKVGTEIVDLLEEGIMQDACNNNLSQQDMLLSVMNEIDFQSFGYDDFYLTLGENTDFVIRRNFDHCPMMDCVLDKVLEVGLYNEIVMQFEELEGDFDLIYHYDYNCMSHRFSYTLNYVNGCGFSGSQSDYATTMSRPNCYEDEQGVQVCNPFSLQLYNKHFCDNLNPLEMAAIFIHETVHSEFHRWIYEGTNGSALSIQDFNAQEDNELWNSIVVEKYGSPDITNHHKLMNEYFVPRLTEDLWMLNGETDPDRKEYYKYFVYDLLSPNDELVSRGFLDQDVLNELIALSQQVTSNLGCE
ncbi:MAG TPA: hypothetical protein ENJ82_06185 [Bacteroidetes bacterium]|nr:hypothetical protein [Bacteroidota bacterium]